MTNETRNAHRLEVGDPVHFWPNQRVGGYARDPDLPFGGFVTFLLTHSSSEKDGGSERRVREINLVYWDHRGDVWKQQGVLMLWPGDPRPSERSFCTLPMHETHTSRHANGEEERSTSGRERAEQIGMSESYDPTVHKPSPGGEGQGGPDHNL